MTEEEKMKVSAIIEKAAYLASVCSHIPSVFCIIGQPPVLAAHVSSIQRTMIIELGFVFDRKIGYLEAAKIQKSHLGFLSLIRCILWGGMLTTPSIAYSETRRLGWCVAEDFDKNRT